MNKLVFFLGPGGAGKTTLAKTIASRRPASIFDMDILLRPAATAIMTMHGLDPDDRDSDEYKSLCRDLGYRITMDAALDNTGLQSDIFVVGPFTKEAADPEWIGRELASAGLALNEIEVKVVLVSLSDAAAYRERIEGRHSPLDGWKFAHWEQFSASLGKRTVAWPLPEDRVLQFDNSAQDRNAAAAAVEAFIYGALPAGP
ncbi:AAA family ATPase [Paenibacillus sp. MMS20-IR301]|uniref:AAA family ATPase n=1 Tax=Paenibacillus sp. MMS20-IR301 TaxID=2895946 RepID=UPI0028F0221F|nr:AAA family ATPase [Paenibacillus sp. MMS20-IR301]WNS45360.1 AAA family ATPase [Paenibacillus sp. MMS20-IR301]